MESLVTNFARSLNSLLVEGAGARRPPDVLREIRRLQRKLVSISAIVTDAEWRIQDEAIKLWSKELKEVIYDAQDIIDDYSSECQQPPPLVQYPRRLSLLPQFVKGSRRSETAKRVREINARLDKIASSEASKRLRPLDLKPQETLIRPREGPSLPIDVVGDGIVEGNKVLSRLLIDPFMHVNQLLAITGVGGIGKTTLAEKIYSDPQIKHHFSLRIWVTVTEHYKETNLLRGIVGGAAYNVDAEVTREKLEEILCGVVKGRRFLIVLDDVWSSEVWVHFFQNHLQSGSLGSKVLVTTRDDSIAKEMGAIHIHRIRPLSAEDSWFLLCNTVSVGDDEQEMYELRHIGMEIVQKCQGLPLAIKSLGGILKTMERSQHEWFKVLEHLKNIRDGFNVDYMSTLYLSYEALPSSTKPCFLFCSLLPQNTKISCRDLMQMWISEGFVEQHTSVVPEDSAERYFAKIVATNLLQLVDSDNMEMDQGCRIHDLIRDFAVCLAQDDNYSGDLSQLNSTNTIVRRLSIGSRETDTLTIVARRHKPLRSILIFDNPLFDDNLLKHILDQLRHLRVLDLRGTVIEELPSSLGEMFHLRYLNLSRTRIRRIPESIGELKNLLFLNLNGCLHLDRLPNGITKLCNLRCLDILHTNLDSMPPGVRDMEHLNTLLGFMPGNICALEELRNLEQMRYLDIRKLDRVVTVGAELQNKKNLRSLVLSWKQDVSRAVDLDEDILEDLQPPASLEQLTIKHYTGSEYPRWMSSFIFPNLVALYLHSCIFSTSLPSLGQLPKLKILSISASKGIATINPEFFGHTELAFPMLEELVIEQMDNWVEWWGPKGRKAFPVLKDIHLRKCPKLRSLPQCLQLSTTLTKLVIESADTIRVIEDMYYVTDLHLKDCPNLERLSYLINMKTLEITRCPLLQDIGDVEALQHLVVEDFALESLPAWLAPNKLMNLLTLEIAGNRDLFRSLQKDSPGRQKFATILQFYAHSIEKKSKVDSVYSLNMNSVSEKIPETQLRLPLLPVRVLPDPYQFSISPAVDSVYSLTMNSASEVDSVHSLSMNTSVYSPSMNSASEMIPETQLRLPLSPVRVPPSPSRFSISPQLSRVESVQPSVSQIYKATKKFSPSLRLGEGRFGTVYKAVLPHGQVVVVQRAKKEHFSTLGDKFSNDFELLSKIEHLNLVKFLGYAEEGNERIIITEHVPNGTLREHLDGHHGKILDFNQRLGIAIDVAHALTYLHFAEKTIIHGDVKSSNILLTENYRAKVSDFGFAIGATDAEQTHITTKVKGTSGYLDPEYLQTYQLTLKSDVFSFGILLIEILSGRRPIELKRAIEERITLRWAFKNYSEGNLRGILDPLLNEPVDKEVLSRMISLAFQCAAPTRADRPMMKEVAEQLWEMRRDYGRIHGR